MAFFIFSKGIYQYPGINYQISVILDFISMLFIGSSLILFTNKTLGSDKYSKQINIFISTSIVATVFCISWYLVTKNDLYPSIAIVCLLGPFGFFIATKIIIFFIKNKLFKEKWKLIISIGTFIYAIGFMFGLILVALNLPDTLEAFIINIGAIVLSSASAYSLSLQFNNEHKELKALKTTLEDKVRKRTIELEVAIKQKTTAFINLAHEIKTPLTLLSNSFKSYTSRVGESPELVDIKYSISQLLQDAVNFLDSEKLERGQIFYDHNQIIDVSYIISQKIPLFQKLADRKHVIINQNIQPGVHSKIDPSAFDRIINNMLDNGIKYNKQYGSINILLRASNEDIFLIFEDTGIGISEEDQKAIFDPYYQVSHLKRNLQGIGMGLYITSEIVKNIGGSISVSSAINNGTIFKISFKRFNVSQSDNVLSNPCLSEPIEEPIYDKCEDVFDDKNRFTLLLVEDNLGLLHSLIKNLSLEHNIICAQNGDEALSKLNNYKEIKPDLIISDVMMDQMNGYLLFKSLQQIEEYKQIPFIFLTAKAIESENIEALKNGAIDYIYKPFSMDVLNAKINSILKHEFLKRELYQNDKYRSIGILSSSISHEILNPLTGIKGPLNVIKRNLGDCISNDPKLSQAMFFINENLNRIGDIVSSLRILYKGGYPNTVGSVALEDVNILALINKILILLKLKINERISFESNIANDLKLHTNLGALSHIIMNLLINSIDAITESGTITISAYNNRELTFCLITISDTGKGIDPKLLNHIFDLGYTSRINSGGSGLGLYIVKEFCKLLNISISVQSAIGKGTTFELKIPL